MNQNVVYVGIDVDDVQYHGSALDRQTGEVLGFQCRPRRAGKSVKTDRIDAAELAQFHANDLLTSVAQPDAEVEQGRDLLRSRQRLIQQQGHLRRHIQSLPFKSKIIHKYKVRISVEASKECLFA